MGCSEGGGAAAAPKSITAMGAPSEMAAIETRVRAEVEEQARRGAEELAQPPCISPHLPASPRISLHLPASPRISAQVRREVEARVKAHMDSLAAGPP